MSPPGLAFSLLDDNNCGDAPRSGRRPKGDVMRRRGINHGRWLVEASFWAATTGR